MEESIQIKIERVSEDIYLDFYADDARFMMEYLKEIQSFDYDAGRRFAEDLWRMIEHAKEVYERFGGKAIVIEFPDDVYRYNFWLEWKTDGIVYGRVLGDKKRYQLRLPLPPILICGDRCRLLGSASDLPSFEVTMDFVSIYVKEERKEIRRFWEREGRIEVWLAWKRVGSSEPAQKLKIGEIKVVWMGHREVDRWAGFRVRKLRRLIEEFRQRREKEFNPSVKAAIARKIKKLEERLQRELLKTRRQWIAGLKVEGSIGGIPIRRIIAFAKKEARAPVSFRALGVESERWGVAVVDEWLLKKMLEGAERVAEFVLREGETKLRGLRGWMNHVIRIVGVPQRKVEVEVLAQVKESAWRNLIKVNKHPIKVSEYNKDDLVKYWVIEPLDNSARFVIVNKDHRDEGLDRIMCHIKKGRYVVFYHVL